MSLWFKNLPSGWEDAPLKSRLARNDGGVWGDDPVGNGTDTIVLRSTEQRVDGAWSIEAPALRKLSKSDVDSSRLQTGDLVVTKSSGSELHIGKTSLVTPEVEALCACYSNFMQRLRVDSRTDPRFVHYWMNNELCREQFAYLSNSTSGLANLNGTVLGTARLAFPSRTEQERIANFLDDKTARIDALIAEKGQLVERLAALRESFISSSVTLHEVAGWVQTRLKYLVQDIVDTEHKTVPFWDDGDYLVARTTNIKKGKLVLEGAKYTDAAGFEEWTRRALPTPGDILFTREAPAGEACLVPEGIPLCLGQRTVLIRLRKDLAYPPFVLWSLYGGLAARFISDLSQGSTVAHFNMPDIGNIPLFVGPIDEQRSRATELERRVADMDALKSHADEHIARLREYRSSLISAAVTGQLDLGVADTQPLETACSITA